MKENEQGIWEGFEKERRRKCSYVIIPPNIYIYMFDNSKDISSLNLMIYY